MAEQLVITPACPIREQKPNPLPDRKSLDDIIFEIRSLTEDERNEVYCAVCKLVKNRREKARVCEGAKCYNQPSSNNQRRCCHESG